jgi:hypothetical protein
VPSLRDLKGDALYRLETLEEEYSEGWGAETQVRAWRTYCEALINAGLVALLADASPASFSLWLTRAGANWRVLLDRASKRGFAVPARYGEPLLAVVATDNFPLAAEIARRSARTKHEIEYDDEFLWALLVQELVVMLAEGRSDLAALSATADRLEKESSDARPGVAKAILARNKAAFWSAVEAVGQEYAAAKDDDAANPAAEYSAWRAAQHVWLEGLALVRLGARLGLGAPSGELPRIPALAYDARPAADDGRHLLRRS